MTESLSEIYERDRSVWDSCARTYERQIVGGHPDVTAYEEFEEDLLDEVLHYLMGEQKQAVKLVDAGCGSARLHCRFGLQMIDVNELPGDVAARVRASRDRRAGCGYESLVADRLRAVEGIDFSAEMIALAKEKLTEAGLGQLLGNRLTLVQGSAFDFEPLASEPLPIVVSVCNSIGVMQGPAGAASLFRSLRQAVEKAGGIAIISAYRREAVGSFALGNYETTLDVCGQPRWLEPDTYAGPEYVQIPRGYKRPFDPDPNVPVDVLDRDGKVVREGHNLTRNPEEVARTIESGHILTHTDYESRWYGFDQFQSWIDEIWGGCNSYHLEGKSLDALRAKPAQLAILDPEKRLKGLLERWS